MRANEAREKAAKEAAKASKQAAGAELRRARRKQFSAHLGVERRHLHPPRHRARIAALEIAVARHRPQREEFRIAVVAQIEHARETRSRCSAARPRSRRRLVRRRDIRCRARPPDDRLRRPPSGRAAPTRSVTRSTARARSRDSRACSLSRPRPSRRPRSGSRRASPPPCAFPARRGRRRRR